MPIKSDYHLHSSFSGDSDTPMEEMILKGIDLGLTRMCFTEHHDLDYPVSESCPQGFFELNPDSYLYDFLKMKEKYAGRISLCFGVELGLQPHLSRRNAAFIKDHDYDFVIASSHICNRKDPYYPSFYEGRSQEEAYLEYFNSILECAMALRKTMDIPMSNIGTSSSKFCGALSKWRKVLRSTLQRWQRECGNPIPVLAY